MNKYKIPGFWKWYWFARWWRRVPRTLHWVLHHDARVIAHIVALKTQSHSWFEQETVTCMLYVDVAGQLWYRAWGRKKTDVPTITLPSGVTYINRLGGQSWRPSEHDPVVFVCEFATSLDEMRRAGTWTLPDTLVL